MSGSIPYFTPCVPDIVSHLTKPEHSAQATRRGRGIGPRGFGSPLSLSLPTYRTPQSLELEIDDINVVSSVFKIEHGGSNDIHIPAWVRNRCAFVDGHVCL